MRSGLPIGLRDDEGVDFSLALPPACTIVRWIVAPCGPWQLPMIAPGDAAGVTLHVENIYGENNHHIVESCFKGLARALRQAVEIDPRRGGAVPSTKGTLSGSLKC